MASVTLGAAPIVKSPLNRLSPSTYSSSRISFSQPETQASPLSISTPSISLTDPSAPVLDVYCGRGDRKTAKGKRFNHSFGNSRPRNKNKGRGAPRVPMPPSTVPKDRYDIDDPVEAKKDDKQED